MVSRRFAALVFVVLSATTVAGSAASGFTDVSGPHAPNIEAIAEAGVTAGCNPSGTLYCPDELVTRAQMATFLARALGLDPIGGTGQSATFDDVSGTHTPNIEAVADAGITLGCNADGTLFCPNERVNRAQMASFLARGFDFPEASGAGFDDVSGSHAANISAIAAAGVTLGCNAEGTLYCPSDPVRRDHMASFLARAMTIDPIPYRITVSSSTLDFGENLVGYVATNRQVTVTNTGDNPVVIESTTIGGEASDDFTITSGGGPTTLQPADERTVWIAYEPIAGSAGVEYATLTVTTDTTDPETVTLQGSAVAMDNLPPSVVNPGDMTGDPGDPVNLQINASDADGDPFTFSATGLPNGLSISSSGLISGTLVESGTSSVVVTADDGVDSGTVQFSWHVSGDDPGAGFDLSLERFHVTQAVPALDSSQASADQVPVVAGRDGLARAFVAADASNNAAPVVQVHWQGSSGSGTMTLGGPGAVPTSPNEGELGDTFAALLAGSSIGADTELYVVVDPDDLIDETDETNNRYPSSGWLSLDAVVVPTLEITFVPITFKGVTPDLSNPEDYLEDTLDMLPIAEYDIEVRSTPWVIEGTTLNWNTVLSDIANLRSADGSDRMYHGIIDPDYSSGIAGIGYIGYPAAVSWSRYGAAGVVAHEIGHNFTLSHAPCGTSGNPDYPHAGGLIGVWGYELDSAELYDPSTYYDFMSYCNPVWISDYYYEQVLERRVAVGYDIVEPAPDETTLIVRGTLDATSTTLAPLMSFDVPAVTPVPGPYLAIGRDSEGAVVFSRSFTPAAAEVWEDAHEVPSGFTFGVTIDRSDLDRLVSVEVVHSGATLAVQRATAASGASAPQAVGDAWTWDTGRYERAVLVDPSTGLMMGYDTTGSIQARQPVDVVLSDGVHSETFQIRP